MKCLFLSHSPGALKVVVICHNSISFVWQRGRMIVAFKRTFSVHCSDWPGSGTICPPHPVDVTDYFAYSLHAWPTISSASMFLWNVSIYIQECCCNLEDYNLVHINSCT
jgi:hypothetical protein